MSLKPVFIHSAAQISAQRPLSDDWMRNPIAYKDVKSVHCIDPDFKAFISPVKSRRMGRLMKRALTVSLSVMRDSGVSSSDAIITGTGLGCIEDTEEFLGAMCRDGEELLSPTPFMQSTHNTISSGIAIYTQCHGYNSTYSQDDISFESALQDAFLMISGGEAHSALVGAHDEATDLTFSLLEKAGYADKGYPLSEGNVAMMLGDGSKSGDTLCEVADVRIFGSQRGLDEYASTINADHIMGRDEIFSLFGKNKSVSGLGAYAAAKMIASGEYRNILIVNDWGEDKALVYLREIC